MVASDTDQNLVQRFKRGDAAAFDMLFTRYQHKIFCLVRRHLRDVEEVHDVVQETFVKVFRALPDFRGDSAFYTWVYRIAINTIKNHVIATSRRPPVVDIDIDDAQFVTGSEFLKEDENPVSALSRDELSVAIEQAISALPDDLRSALTLRELDGLSYEQIASILECPVGTVRSRIFRAREAIDQRIRPLLD